MSCYHPLLRVGYHPLGDPYGLRYKVIPYTETAKADFFKQRLVVESETQIPCGQCTGCRLDYSKQWANRCMMELQYHENAWFVTLTYDDAHVRKTEYLDEITGALEPALTLCKRDFQLFMKRLRKNNPDVKIRFFAAGEYGGQTFRPHYHAIIFGLPLDDLQVYKTVKQGDMFYTYYNSPTITKAWSLSDEDYFRDGSITPLSLENLSAKHLEKPIGYAVIGKVTWETCAYTARYVMKKLKGEAADFYSKHNIEPPFTLMSRKPGIARQYYEDHPEVYEYEYINISTPTGGRKFRPPGYFDSLFDLDFPEEARSRKESRRNAAERTKQLKLERTDLSYLELLAVEESALKDRLKKLERKLEK